MYDVKIIGMRRVTFNDMRLEKQRWHLTIVIYQTHGKNLAYPAGLHWCHASLKTKL